MYKIIFHQYFSGGYWRDVAEHTVNYSAILVTLLATYVSLVYVNWKGLYYCSYIRVDGNRDNTQNNQSILHKDLNTNNENVFHVNGDHDTHFPGCHEIDLFLQFDFSIISIFMYCILVIFLTSWLICVISYIRELHKSSTLRTFYSTHFDQFDGLPDICRKLRDLEKRGYQNQNKNKNVINYDNSITNEDTMMSSITNLLSRNTENKNDGYGFSSNDTTERLINNNNDKLINPFLPLTPFSENTNNNNNNIIEHEMILMNPNTEKYLTAYPSPKTKLEQNQNQNQNNVNQIALSMGYDLTEFSSDKDERFAHMISYTNKNKIYEEDINHIYEQKEEEPVSHVNGNGNVINSECSVFNILSILTREDDFISLMFTDPDSPLNEIIPERIPRRKHVLTSSGLVWYLRYIISGLFTKDNRTVRDDIDVYITEVKRRSWFLGILCFSLLPPFLLIGVAYFCLRYAEEIRSQRRSIFQRTWSSYATIFLRNFSEPTPLFNQRMSRANKFADQITNISFSPSITFPSVKRIARYVIGLITGFLIMVSVINDNAALYVTLFNFNLLWYLALCGILLQLLITDKNEECYVPEDALDSVLSLASIAPYIPGTNPLLQMKRNNEIGKGSNIGNRVSLFFCAYRKFQKTLKTDYYMTRIECMSDEIIGLLCTPFFLYYWLPAKIQSICEFVKINSIHIPDSGDICAELLPRYHRKPYHRKRGYSIGDESLRDLPFRYCVSVLSLALYLVPDDTREGELESYIKECIGLPIATEILREVEKEAKRSASGSSSSLLSFLHSKKFPVNENVLINERITGYSLGITEYGINKNDNLNLKEGVEIRTFFIFDLKKECERLQKYASAFVCGNGISSSYRDRSLDMYRYWLHFWWCKGFLYNNNNNNNNEEEDEDEDIE